MTTAEVVQGKGFQAEVIRTNRRKTVTVKVEGGRVAVVVPRFTTKAKVEALVGSQENPVDSREAASATGTPATETEGVRVWGVLHLPWQELSAEGRDRIYEVGEAEKR